MIMMNKSLNPRPTSYEQLIHHLETMSIAKVTNSQGDQIDKHIAKKLIMAAVTLLQSYRSEDPNPALEKTVLDRLSGY